MEFENFFLTFVRDLVLMVHFLYRRIKRESGVIVIVAKR